MYMYAYIHMHVYVCIHYIHIYTYIHLYIYIYIHTYACIYIYILVCIYIYIYYLLSLCIVWIDMRTCIDVLSISSYQIRPFRPSPRSRCSPSEPANAVKRSPPTYFRCGGGRVQQSGSCRCALIGVPCRLSMLSTFSTFANVLF